MTVFWLLSFGILAAVVVYLMDPFGWFAGSGTRRAAAKPTPEARAVPARACENCGHLPGMPTTAQIADSDRSDPAPKFHQDAPIEAGCRDTAAANAETQPLSVADLRKATGEADTQTLPAVTPVKPVPPLRDPLPRVTWGVKEGDKAALEAWATQTAPPPDAGPTEVCAALGQFAHIKVAAATTSTD